MNKQKFDVNTLRVASPCSVGWEKMSGDERARFCNLCQLNVYNISEMTEDEVAKLIIKREGRLCLRLYKRADGTVLTKDCPVGFRAYQKRVTRFAGATLATILGLFSINFAQDKSKDDKPIDASKVKVIRTASQESILRGTILYQMGAVIPGTKIILHNSDGKEFNVVSNDEGSYIFSSIPAGTYNLQADKQEQGFKIYNLEKLEIKENELSQLDIVLTTVETNFIMGDVIALPSKNTSDLLTIKPLEPQTKKPRKTKKIKN